MSNIRHYIIYIPGLGNGSDGGRKLALKFWRFFGVQTELVPMFWYDAGPFQEKLERVIQAVEAAEAKGYTVSIVGESAGGSMAINAVAACPNVYKLVTIAGANDPDAKVSPLTLQKSPAFDVSLQMIRHSIKRINLERTFTIRALSDRIVHARHAIIKDARNLRIFSIGHMATIILCLTVVSPYVIVLIKKG